MPALLAVLGVGIELVPHRPEQRGRGGRRDAGRDTASDEAGVAVEPRKAVGAQMREKILGVVDRFGARNELRIPVGGNARHVRVPVTSCAAPNPSVARVTSPKPGAATDRTSSAAGGRYVVDAGRYA